MIKNKSIVIAALARDCAKALENNIPRIEELRAHFTNSYVIIVENDSKDGTKETLVNWKRTSENVFLISQDFHTVTIPKKESNMKPGTSCFRIEKMAKYRNMYMEFIDSLDASIDYVLMIDLDIEKFSVKGVVDSIIDAPEDWGGLFAYGTSKNKIKLSRYYDGYAFLEYWNNSFELKSKHVSFARRYVTTMMYFRPYLRCNSAFSGIGIYKYELIRGKRYYCQPNMVEGTIESICEHVPFNLSIIELSYNNYISRKMKVRY
ncbi:hypothetical protein [Bacteroides sp.]